MKHTIWSMNYPSSYSRPGEIQFQSVIYSSDDAEHGFNDSANTTLSILKNKSFRIRKRFWKEHVIKMRFMIRLQPKTSKSPNRHSTPLKTQSSEELIASNMKERDDRIVQSDWKPSPTVKSRTKRWIDFTSESE